MRRELAIQFASYLSLQASYPSILILANYCFSLQNDKGFTPLMGACITGQVDVTKLLLEHKATVDYQAKVIYLIYLCVA